MTAQHLYFLVKDEIKANLDLDELTRLEQSDETKEQAFELVKDAIAQHRADLIEGSSRERLVRM